MASPRGRSWGPRSERGRAMATADPQQLEQPLSAGAIRSVNFFNGRLLSGRDLSRLEDARRQADRLVGLGLGEGVASGLAISFTRAMSPPGPPVAHLGTGIAINRRVRGPW